MEAFGGISWFYIHYLLFLLLLLVTSKRKKIIVKRSLEQCRRRKPKKDKSASWIFDKFANILTYSIMSSLAHKHWQTFNQG